MKLNIWEGDLNISTSGVSHSASEDFTIGSGRGGVFIVTFKATVDKVSKKFKIGIFLDGTRVVGGTFQVKNEFLQPQPLMVAAG